MENLPPDLAALLPLGKTAWATLACASRSMRDLVAHVRCLQGATVREQWIFALQHPRYEQMTTLRVLAPSQPYTARPSPVPVPRQMPSLRALHLKHCRPCDERFWAVVVDRAPRLQELVVSPMFFGANYASVLRSCVGMLRQAERLGGLTRLEVRGDGMANVHRRDAALAVQEMRDMDVVRFPLLHRLVITGQQFFPAMDAPLRDATFEEPNQVGVRMVDRVGRFDQLRRLSWRVAPSHLPVPGRFDGLENLQLRVRRIRCESEFDSVMSDLAHLPTTLKALDLHLDFQSMSGEDPALSYERRPLQALHRLERLAVRVPFPTQGFGALVSGLLGAPPGALRDATIEALGGPADRLRNVLDVMLGDDADPESEDVLQLEEEIEALEVACRLRTEDVHAALSNFQGTMFVLRGMPDVPCHARIKT